MIARRWPAPTVVLVAAGLAAVASGQEREDGLAALAKLAAEYRVTPGDGRVARLEEEPAIRWNTPISEVDEASLFLWTLEGRPVAAGTFLRQRRTGVYHEFQSLATGPLEALRDGRPAWSTRTPGVEYAPVPGAPAPADTRVKRQAQMRAMAEDFRAEAVKGPPFYGEGSVSRLRLLPRPLYRYNDPAHPEREGALFAFAQGTDPEALLLLESRPHGGGARWEFALAPMTGWQVRGWHKDAPVWSVERRHPGHDPSQPYFVAGPFPDEGGPRGR